MKSSTNLTIADIGKLRVKDKFLWKPRNFNGNEKWLCFAQILEQVKFINRSNNPDKMIALDSLDVDWVEIDFYE